MIGRLSVVGRFVLLIGLTMLLVTISYPSARAQEADLLVSFDSAEQNALYQRLLEEYRCLKCQNQNLADSNAGLAGDLRREIRDQILAGKSKPDIDEYLVARYGEFVLYRPRFSSKTAVLWLAPFILLIIALASVFVMVRKRAALTRSRAAVAVTDAHNPAQPDDQLEQRLEKAKKLLQN